MRDITHIRCIDVAAIRPDWFAPDALTIGGVAIPETGAELFLVLGIARNIALGEVADGTRELVMHGEFEAMVLGKPGRWQSRTCRLYDCEASALLKTHVMRWPQGYEVAAVCMGHQSERFGMLARYIIRHLHMNGDPTSG